MSILSVMISEIILCCILSVSAFNLSPKPNVIFKEPRLSTVPSKVQSSYFGLSLILRESSLYVGAPRAQSSLQSQNGIQEPGAIYKCPLKTGQCTPYNFDTKGNIPLEPNEYTWNSDNKDNQWLGATMDGGSSDRDRMVVCAPRFFANSTLAEGYLMHGICYVASNTLGDQPAELRIISPLRLKSDQTRLINGMDYFYNAYAEMGFSVHCSESKDEIIFGAPGLAQWKGSMVRNREYEDKNIDVSRSRRDAHINPDKRDLPTYTSETLQPEFWGQHNDTYFGYAVTSGYFDGPNSTRLLYIASAPQSVSKKGEAYLFSIASTRYTKLSIAKHYTFEGTQFGEYFGYSILAEDVNGDNFTDVIISAPNHYIPNSYENGAVYVFLNLRDVPKIRQGRPSKFKQTLFSEPLKITTENSFPGRFGTTLSKIGDINLDGYNDIAISAPFSNKTGAVFIYLGGPSGLKSKPSQVLASPTPSTITSQPMFGFGLSRGVDIDLNGYNDMSIGAPNEDSAYLFRAYPVVKIIATIDSPIRQLQIDQKKIEIKICWQIQTKSNSITAQDVNFQIRFDPILKRVQVSGEKNFKGIAKLERQCKIYAATVKESLRDIFRPIEIEMHFDLINAIPDSNVFCETCAVVDPEDPKFITQKIAFMTGCKSERCLADLKVKSINLKSPFILGSSDSITIKYVIQNEGEFAYLPQINVTSSNNMPFTKIPPTCELVARAVLECNLNNYLPMGTKSSTTITVGFDASYLQGTKARIRAQVFSVGDELNTYDNVVEDVVLFAEYSQIESAGKALTPIISLADSLGVKKIENVLEIRNHGPSSVKQLDVTLLIPLSYIIPYTRMELPVIDFNNITVIPIYDDRILEVTYTQNGTVLIQNSVEKVSLKKEILINSTSSLRLPTENKADLIKSISNRDYEAVANRRVDTELAKELLSGTLPINRTVFLNCYENREVKCVEATFTVNNLHKDSFLNITFNYTIDLDIVDKLLIPEKDFLVVTTLVGASRLGDAKGTTIKISGIYPNNVISKHHLYGTPIWVYIVSILGGLLILCGITFGMYKLGFFKRDKLQELQAAKHETQPLNEGES